MQTYQTRTIDSLAGLEDIKPCWQRLCGRLPQVLPTQTFEYVQAYVTAFDLSGDPWAIIALYDQDQLCALLPLVTRRRKAAGISLTTLNGMDLPMPIRDAIVAPGIQMQSIVQTLKQTQSDPWVYLHMRALPDSSLLLEPATLNNTLVLHHPCGRSNAISVDDTDHHATHLSRNFRSDLKRKMKRLEKQGAVELVTCTEPAELETAFEEFLDTEAAGWKSVSGGKRAVKLHADQTAFYRQLMRNNAATGHAHIHLLRVNETAIASDYCIVANGVSFSLKHGFNEAWLDYSPGNLLRSWTIRYYEQQADIHTLDLVSDWDWHQRWHPQSRPIHDLKVFHSGLASQLLYRAIQFRRQLSAPV